MHFSPSHSISNPQHARASSRSLANLLLGMCILSPLAFACSAPLRTERIHILTDTQPVVKPQFSLDSLEQGRVYIILVAAYPLVIELSTLALGSQSKYGHIELVYNGQAYGCRQPTCGAMPVQDLVPHFLGRKYLVREVHAKNIGVGVNKFIKQFEGKDYDLLYRNCTDAVYNALAASSVPALPKPLSVAATYAKQQALREFMESNVIPLPNRKTVVFPDQFLGIGNFVGEGTF